MARESAPIGPNKDLDNLHAQPEPIYPLPAAHVIVAVHLVQAVVPPEGLQGHLGHLRIRSSSDEWPAIFRFGKNKYAKAQ